MAKLGFVGLGVMGSRVVKRLLDAGHSVVGYNRTRSKAQWLLDAGMTWGESPRAVAESADVVFSMVTNTAALRSYRRRARRFAGRPGRGKDIRRHEHGQPGLQPGTGKKSRWARRAMLDAPVSGSVITLEEGKLSIMVGGDPAVFEKVKPILLDIGPKVTHVGANGLAVTMKIATNLSLAVQMLAFSEGVLIAEKSGIKREVAVDVLMNSVIASPMVKYRGPFVLQMPEEAWFNVNMMQKDMNLALELGRQLNVPLPTTAVTNEFLTAARGFGLEEKDFAILFEVLAKMSGVNK